MPKQYVLFGRPIPRIGSRRLSVLLVGISLFAVFSLYFTLPSTASTRGGASSHVPADGSSNNNNNNNNNKFGLPRSFTSPWRSPFMKSFNPFRQPSHPPPRQANDTDGEASWYPNMKWLSIPFSSSVTLEENRALLPVLPERPPIYCYYDNTLARDGPGRDAESAVLLAWRRAWWAQGFKPVILSPAEAMNNPLYEVLQAMDVGAGASSSSKASGKDTGKDGSATNAGSGIDPSLKTDLMRWLAWENMGGGLLAHYLLFPMAARDDPLLTFLRRGQYPTLTRWTDLDDGLFAGPKAEVAAALKLVMSSAAGTGPARTAKNVLAALQADQDNYPFTVDSAPSSLAFYSARAIEKRYGKVGEAIAADRADGLRQLERLITGHLHLTWLGQFGEGIAVVKPLPQHTTHMIAPAYELAVRLSHCPDSPLPATCPPNNPKCNPCVASRPPRISTPQRYHNSTTVYTIGTVPHPFTTAALRQLRGTLDVAWVRRASDRDAWVTALTRDLVPGAASSAPRLLRFKEAVASDAGAARSLWLTAEAEGAQPPADHLDWHFGFPVPTEATWTDPGKSETPVPGPERRPAAPPADPLDGPVATPEDLAREPPLLQRAREVVNARGTTPRGNGGGGTDPVVVRNAVEAWNLGDTEAWRFARAYLAREIVERRKFEDEEAKYAGGMGSENSRRRESGSSGKTSSSSSGWGRWLDSDSENRRRWMR